MSHDERRNSFRFPLREELRDATLEVRSRRSPVELIDQSAEGFSVQAPRDFEVALDEVVTIETWAGRCQAVVARLVDCRDCRRLGLRRVSDITACVKHSPGLLGWLKQKLPRQPDKESRPQAADDESRQQVSVEGARPPATDEQSRKHVAWAVAAIAATLLVAIAWMFKPAARPATLANERGASGAANDDSALAIDPDADPAENNAAARRSSAATTGQAATDAKATAAIADHPPQAMLERLAALRSPKVAGELALSEHQKLEISRLLKKVSSEVSRARTRLGGKSRAAREAKLGAIMVDAEAQARAILNPEQQARWQSE